jgi:hypothetical protein
LAEGIYQLRQVKLKKDDYTDIICKGFCMFYNEGKEGLACGTYEFLKGNLTPHEIDSCMRDMQAAPDFSRDKEIRVMVCGKCDFLVDGCDFREGLAAPPCGGYTIIEWLLKRGTEDV